MKSTRPQFSRPELKRLAEACWYAERDRAAAVGSIIGVLNKKPARDLAAFRRMRARIATMLDGNKQSD